MIIVIKLPTLILYYQRQGITIIVLLLFSADNDSSVFVVVVLKDGSVQHVCPNNTATVSPFKNGFDLTTTPLTTSKTT